MFNPIVIHMNSKPIYNIHFTQSYNILPDIILNEVLNNTGKSNRKVFIVADSNVATYHLQAVIKQLEDNNITNFSYTFLAGEENKHTGTIGNIYEKLIDNHLDRNDLLIALGGGVCGDMTGFAAATYLRGIKFIQLPTSLLAMVDSSIGGKTGVDYNGYKNMVGAFHMPSAVITNTEVLKTLPDREYISGFAEIIKHALIDDKDYYNFLFDNSTAALNKDLDVVAQIIYKSCNIKKKVVEEDPTEKGIRAHLNFGHTLGHAIEKYMNFNLLHGECVSLGCIASMYISYRRGHITLEEFNNAKELFSMYGLPVKINNLNKNEVINITSNDKKADGNTIKFVLLKCIGQAYIDTTVTKQEMYDALSIICEE
ncbi:MAG: 3-dehydroquinate synthase [Lachnospiraceae bacterium]|nr:3-dehydroquinate synthase [Lachnospiraceae bacterium]